MRWSVYPLCLWQRRLAIRSLIALSLVLVGCGNDGETAMTPEARGSSVPSPSLEGPVSGGLGQPFIASTIFDLAQVGYAQTEYFISGTATAYATTERLTSDGMWTVMPDTNAAYKTRILIYRPIDPTRFNGTVIVEWLNVSGGLDTAPGWIMSHTELTRSGYAWVGVSAQYVGVEGGEPVLGTPAIPLKTTDPDRYGSLVHPGDSFSYDIYSQAAQALRRPTGRNPLGDLKPEAIIAAGESQSAFRIVTYINAVHPLADIYDGFLVHSRGATSVSTAPLSQTPQPAIGVPGATLIRTDLNVPVLTFQTETDLTFFGSARARQEDSERFRLWEVAGTAHADTYTVMVGRNDLGNDPSVANLVFITTPGIGEACDAPINSGPQHFVLKAAVAALNRWVRQGTPPPHAPRLEITSGLPVIILRDADGNALGGIRTPQVDVPIATLTGDVGVLSVCSIFGFTTPFDAEKLASLYADHTAYVRQYNQATDRAVDAGFLLPADAALMKTNAAQSAVP